MLVFDAKFWEILSVSFALSICENEYVGFGFGLFMCRYVFGYLPKLAGFYFGGAHLLIPTLCVALVDRSLRTSLVQKDWLSNVDS